MDRNSDNRRSRFALDSVALRKESVDRNKLQRSIDKMSQPSLSARRAWIEISGSLDDILAGVSRSPQGERG